MSMKSTKSNVKKNFTIENNIVKGFKMKLDVQEKSLAKLIYSTFTNNLDHVGQIDAQTGKQTTFAEMREKSVRCALWMQKEGFKRGDVIGICTQDHMNTYIPLIASFFVGATQNHLYPYITIEEAPYYLRLTKPRLMFACESSIDILIKAAELENLDVKFIVMGKHPKIDSLEDVMKLQTKDEIHNFQLAKTDPNDIGIIIFTSGTTSKAKGIQLSIQKLYDYTKTVSFLPRTTNFYLWYSGPYWITGILLQLQCIAFISTRIQHNYFDPHETCKYIEKYKVNFFFLSIPPLNKLLKADVLNKYDLSSLQIVLTGGVKCSYKIIEQCKSILNIPVCVSYGLSETCGICTSQRPDNKNGDSIGYILPNYEIKIIDLKTGQALGPNQPGELCIKSPYNMVGYLNNIEETKKLIDNEGWLHSGDLGYYDDNGEFFAIDRLSELINVSGHQISPALVEDILLNHPAVLEAIVVPAKHKLYGEKLVALVQKNPNLEVTEEELIQLSSQLGKFETLAHVKFVEKVMYTYSTKINRKAAKKIARVFDE